MMPRVETAPHAPLRKGNAPAQPLDGDDAARFDAAMAEKQDNGQEAKQDSALDEHMPDAPASAPGLQAAPQNLPVGMLFALAFDRAEGQGAADPQEANGSRPLHLTQASLGAGDHAAAKGAEAGPEDALITGMTIEHVSSQVHFAPVMSDPIRQIAAGVASSMAEPAASVSQAPPSDTPSSPIKTLQLKLEPENLGTVTLHLRLSGNQLSVRVDVAEPSTLHMLTKEQDRLHKSLSTDTCQLEHLEIRASHPVAEAAPTQRSDEGARDGSGFSPREGSPQGQSRARAESQARHASQQGKQNEDRADQKTRRDSVRGLYL